MRITERRLRQIIRNVIIEEQRALDEGWKDTAVGLGMAGMAALGGMSGKPAQAQDRPGIEQQYHDVSYESLFGKDQALKQLNKRSGGEIKTLLQACQEGRFESETDVENWIYNRSGMPTLLGMETTRKVEALGKLSWAIWTNGGRAGSGHDIENILKSNLSSKDYRLLFNVAENGLMMLRR